MSDAFNTPVSVDPRLLEVLVCPVTRGRLTYDRERNELISAGAKLAFPIRDGVPIMLAEDARPLDWEHAPEARYCHPHEDHLLPLLIAAGAATGEPGRRAFGDQVLGVRISAFEFGDDDAARPPTTTFLSHTTTSLPRSTS